MPGRGEAGQIRLIVFPRIPSTMQVAGVGFRDRVAALQETGGHDCWTHVNTARCVSTSIPTGPHVDPVPARGPVAGSPAKPRATRCPAPNRSLRNIRPATTGSSTPGSGGAVKGSGLFYERVEAVPPIACRRDAPVRPAETWDGAVRRGCPWPCARALDPVDPFAMGLVDRAARASASGPSHRWTAGARASNTRAPPANREPLTEGRLPAVTNGRRWPVTSMASSCAARVSCSDGVPNR